MTESVSVTPAPAAADFALTATAADLLQQPPAMTVEQAQAKKAELFGTAGFAERVARGDPEATAEVARGYGALRPEVDQSTSKGSDYAKTHGRLAILKNKADLSRRCMGLGSGQGPVSPAENERAIFAKQRLFKTKRG